METVRKSAERCDSLQAFFLLHSTGGGTGSGLGSRVLSLLEDSFPEAYRFAGSVFPYVQRLLDCSAMRNCPSPGLGLGFWSWSWSWLR